MYQVNFNILNVKNSPSVAADVAANRPTSAAVGAIYISTDTKVLERWNGTSWDAIGGGISGTGTVNKIPVWTSASALGSSDLVYTVPGAYPNKQIISGCSFESQYSDPPNNGDAAGYIVRRTSNNNIIATLLGKDTTANATQPIFNTYVQDDYYIKVFGSANYYHTFFKNGNVVHNGYVDAGYNVDINGTLRSSASITTQNGLFTFGNGTTPIPLIIKNNWSVVTSKGISIGSFNSDITSYSSYPILIGNSISLGDTTDGGVYIGTQIGVPVSTGTSRNHVVVGIGNTISANTISSAGNVIIGNSNTFNAYTNNQINNICVGGFNSNPTLYYGVQLFGSSIKPYANNQLVFGYNSDNVDFGIRDVFIGYGVRNEYTSANSNNGNGIEVSINPSGAYNGTDKTGGNLVLAAGKGTGAGTGGDVIFSTPTTTTSGTTLQTLTKRWFVKQSSGTLSNQSSVLSTALIDLYSTTQGLKVPVMTTTQKNAIANTAGLIVFDSTLAKLCINSGSGWQTITSV